MPLCTLLPHALSPARACSSITTASWANVPPPPPYSSGIDRHSSPTSPAFVHRSRSTCFCAAQRSWFGVISLAMNVRASSRSWSRSSVIHAERRFDIPLSQAPHRPVCHDHRASDVASIVS
jgi:hypothetical protein